jgi:NADH-quinone oxidoreductase subunit M
LSGDPNTSFRMVATIIACTSIVVTAVYILRVVGKILYGEVENKHFLELTDATWDERVAVICLIFCVAGLGCMPFFFSDMISPAAGTILESIGVM